MATIAKKTSKKSRNSKNSPKEKEEKEDEKKTLKDIAAIFGPQISTKKVKTGAAKLRPRRGSETLRLQKKKLKNIIKSSKKKKNENNPFDISLKSTRDINETEEEEEEQEETVSITNTNININIECIQTETTNEIDDDETDFHLEDMDDMDDNDVDTCDIDEFMEETYGRSRKFSQTSSSSFFSSISSYVDFDADFDVDFDVDCDIEQGHDARGSVVCNDMDRDSINYNLTDEDENEVQETTQTMESKQFYTNLNEMETGELFMDVSKETKYQQHFEENKRLSQQIIMMGEIDDDDIKTSDYSNINAYDRDHEDRSNNIIFDISDIGAIGAIKTSDYCKKTNKKDKDKDKTKNEIDQFALDQFYIDSDDEYYSAASWCNDNFSDSDSENENDINPLNDDIDNDINPLILTPFKQRRESEIENDLFDLLITDDSSDNNDSNDSNNQDKTNINELLTMFGLFLFCDSNIFNYFSKKLCIHYCYEILNILPHKISKPIHCFNMKQLMKLNKMVKYISHNVYNNISPWSTPGKYTKEWIEVEYNRIANTFQYNSIYLINYNQYNYNFHADDENIISLNGYETYYLDVDISSFDDCKEVTYKMIVKELPNKYRFEPKLFKFGVEVDDEETDEIESLYITDRLAIRKNENYLKSMFLGKFVENESFIFMKLGLSKLHGYLDINLWHAPNLQITKFDHTTFDKHFALKINEDTANTKLFITQYNGNGQYVINKL